MPTITITAAEVFADSDPDHAFATVTRVGGGEYQVRRFDGALLFDDVDGEQKERRAMTYENAIRQAADWAASGDKVDASSVRQLRGQLAELERAHAEELDRRDAEITRIVDDANNKLRALRDQVAEQSAHIDKLKGKPAAPTVSAPAEEETTNG